MSGTYRDKILNAHMEDTGALLSAIAAKETLNLRVLEILKKDPEMSFDKATIIGMQEAANQANMRVVVMATSFDRTIRMAASMAREMTVANIKNGQRYEKRLEILTDFDKIALELTPPKMPGGPNFWRAAINNDDDEEFYDEP